nr:putative Ig domain-containing protein [Alphaproteobacteria bacterium]
MKTDLSHFNQLTVDYMSLNTQLVLGGSGVGRESDSRHLYIPLASTPVVPYEQVKNIAVSIFVTEHTIASITNLNGGSLSLRIDPRHLWESLGLQPLYEFSSAPSNDVNFSGWSYESRENSSLFLKILANHTDWFEVENYATRVFFEDLKADIANKNIELVSYFEPAPLLKTTNIPTTSAFDTRVFDAFTGSSIQVNGAPLQPQDIIKDTTIKPNPDVVLNNAPIAMDVSNQFVNEDSRLNYNLSKHFHDIDPGDHLTFKAVLSNGSPLPSWLSFNENTGVLSGVPANENVGVLWVRAIAIDSQGLSVSINMKITVNNTNDAPTVTPITDTRAAEDASFSYNVSGQFADVDVGDGLTYALGQGAPAWLQINANTGELSGTPANGDVGVVNVTVLATDNSGASVSDTFQITVNNTNDAPTVTPITDTRAAEDASFSYNVSGQFSDVDVGDGLTYALGQGAPAWLQLNANTGELSGTPANGDVGVVNVTVLATDNSGASVSDAFQITVNNTNDAPTVTPITDTRAAEDASFSYNVSGQFSDVDVGDGLTYALG